MGVLRARLDRDLKRADHEDRYRLLWPKLPWLADDQGCLNVHSKVLVADDAFAMIGSANLSNRSMGLDTECNASPSKPRRRAHCAGHCRDAQPAPCRTSRHVGGARRGIARLHGKPARHHRRATPSRRVARWRRRRWTSIRRSKPSFRITLCSIRRRPPTPTRSIEDLAPATAAPRLTRVRVRGGLRRNPPVRRRARACLAHTPLRELLSPERLVAFAEDAGRAALAPMVVLAAFVVGGFVLVPVTLLIAATVLVFGSFEGAAYAFGGALASAAATYAARTCARARRGPALCRPHASTSCRSVSRAAACLRWCWSAWFRSRLSPSSMRSLVPRTSAGATSCSGRARPAPGIVVTAAVRRPRTGRRPRPRTGYRRRARRVAALAVGGARWSMRRLGPRRAAPPRDGEHAG